MAAPKGTIVLTGANGGLGTGIVGAIVADSELSSYHGIYTVRNANTAPSLQSALRIESSSHTHDILSLDLSDLASVRDAAARINDQVSSGKVPPIRALVLNAARREVQGQTRTDAGLDIAFAGNYLGHWLLVLLLLQSLDRESGRVVVVGSWTHDPHDIGNKASGAYASDEWKKIFVDASSKTVESIARGDWSPPKDPAKDRYGAAGIRRYGASKLCLAMTIVELQRRLDSDPVLGGISILGVDPGLMPTQITTGGLGWLVGSIYTIVMHCSGRIWPNGTLRLIPKSAGDVLAAAFGKEPPFGERPKALYMNGSEPKDVSVEAKDAVKRGSLWKASVKYAQLNEGETCLAAWA